MATVTITMTNIPDDKLESTIRQAKEEAGLDISGIENCTIDYSEFELHPRNHERFTLILAGACAMVSDQNERKVKQQG